MARSALVAMVVVSSLGLPAGARAQKAASDPEARFAAGLNHLREGRADLAVEDFKKAVDQDDKNPYYLKGLGQAYAQQRKFKEAVEAFRKSLVLSPYFVDVRNDLGMALILSGKREEGRKEFVTAYEDPTNPTPEISARNLGQAYLEDKNYPEAIQWFRSAIARNRVYADPYLGLAEALVASGRLEEAVSQLEAGVREAPNDPAMLTGYGQMLLKAGRFTEARVQLEAAIKKDPSGSWGQTAAAVLKTAPK